MVSQREFSEQAGGDSQPGTGFGGADSGRTPVDVVLRGAAKDRRKDRALRNAASKAQVRVTGLDQMSELVLDPKLSVIRRLNQSRALTVSASSDQMTTFELLAYVSPSLDQLASDIGVSYQITIGGEIEMAAIVRVKLANGMPYALIPIVVALMIQFNSCRRGAKAVSPDRSQVTDHSGRPCSNGSFWRYTLETDGRTDVRRSRSDLRAGIVCGALAVPRAVKVVCNAAPIGLSRRQNEFHGHRSLARRPALTFSAPLERAHLNLGA
nr:hypothetical protein [uncultured Shimia sp.]